MRGNADHLTELREYIRTELKARGWTIHEFAGMVGLSAAHLYNVLDYNFGTSPEALGGMAKALGVPVEKLYLMAGYPVTEIGPKLGLVREIWVILEQLTEEDLETLLRTAQGLRATGGNVNGDSTTKKASEPPRATRPKRKKTSTTRSAVAA